MIQDAGPLERVVENYCNAVSEEVRNLHDLLKYRRATRAHPKDVARRLHADTHRMSGAAHCMGFRDFGNRLSRMEKKLEKALHKNPAEIEIILESLEERVAVLFSLLPHIHAGNSRVLQILEENRSESESDTNKATPDATKALSGLRILLADDDPHICALMASTLESMGVGETHSVKSGLEVLRAIDEFRPDMIVTDWQMEPISGFELLQCIRSGETPIRKDTPIIFFTGEEDRSFMQMALSNGADRFLRKPVSPEILEASILHILERRPETQVF